MAAELVTVGAGANQTVVAAATGKIHRLKRLLTVASANLTFKSGSTEITPKMTAGDISLDVRWDREFPQTASGEALVVANDDMAVRKCWIEYDSVDG